MDSGYRLIGKIKGNAHGAHNRYAVPTLSKIEKSVSKSEDVYKKGHQYEWKKYHLAIYKQKNSITVNILPSEYQYFKEQINVLEKAYQINHIPEIDEAIEQFVLLGQEILRRKYFALLCNNQYEVALSKVASFVINAGATAIQVLGRAPSGPKHPYRTFSIKTPPRSDDLGVEILTSGAFPDWDDHVLGKLRRSGKIKQTGFENVIEGGMDTPRARALAKALSLGKNIHPLDFSLYNRLMLDLELMRLGQATTPGTYDMLLNSFYHGAMIVDHSTNVSEQVQIILAKEEWTPALIIPTKIANDAKQAAIHIINNFFRFAKDSPIKKNHPRIARIHFEKSHNSSAISSYLLDLRIMLKNGFRYRNKKYPSISSVHQIIPTLVLKNGNRYETVKDAIHVAKNAGFRKLTLVADMVQHKPGLLQFFSNIDEANKALKYARSKRVNLINGRHIDIIATVNKSIEAAAGAMNSGQGCIKIGLLGLTYEEMKHFIRMVKHGMNYHYRREQNYRLVFIGIIDEPLVTNEEIITDSYKVSSKFIELMRITNHNILLLDTIHKGGKDKRLVDANDRKGGHLTRKQLQTLVSKARKQGRHGCDIWVAGSYTEDLVYETAKDAPDKRPSLICLGGAERNFSGIRIESRDVYISNSHSDKEDIELLNCWTDIKYFLSADNKLARDAGHVIGCLNRRNKNKENHELEKIRERYLFKRNEYIKSITRKNNNINTNYLIDNQFKENHSNNKLKELKKIREEYMNLISIYLIKSFKL